MDVVLAIDQGTQSTRVSLYDKQKECICSSVAKLTQYIPQQGYCEQSPNEIIKQIYGLTECCMKKALKQFPNVSVKGIGITNQRETVVAWDVYTGDPLYNAIVWRDTRTESLVNAFAEEFGGINAYKHLTGLPLNNYITAMKIKWMMINVNGLEEKLRKGTAVVGTIDTWIVWNLTRGEQRRGREGKYFTNRGNGGIREIKNYWKANRNEKAVMPQNMHDSDINRGCHITDVTNASRTYLMDIKSCKWSSFLLEKFDIPLKCLPKICSSSEIYGYVKNENLHGCLQNVPISGIAGDQQAACVGHNLFSVGQFKCTYGTGAFVLVNTGDEAIIPQDNTLFCTPCYQLGKNEPVKYALEGAIKTAGAGVTYLKDVMKIIDHPNETVELFDKSIEKEEELKTDCIYKCDDIVYVPNISGSFAGENGNWYIRKTTADFDTNRNKEEIVKALLQGISYQLYEIVQNILKYLNITAISTMYVDGGVTENDAFMKFTASLMNCVVERPSNREVTSVGAAVLAGLGCGFWENVETVEKIEAKERSTIFFPDDYMICGNANLNNNLDVAASSPIWCGRYERSNSAISTSSVVSPRSVISPSKAKLERLDTWKNIVFSQSSGEEWVPIEEFLETKKKIVDSTAVIDIKETNLFSSFPKSVPSSIRTIPHVNYIREVSITTSDMDIYHCVGNITNAA